ncbi:MAG: hypothetical protein ABL949_08730 [Fimbriimonadaceae bacterium]
MLRDNRYFGCAHTARGSVWRDARSSLKVLVDGGTWTQIYATKRSRITLSGFTPGVPTAFRVKAENRNQVTLPSNEAEIYPASAPEMTLRFAA